MKRVAITTKDNPFDPFEQFSEWFHFDCVHGYNSCQLLARFSRSNESYSDEQNCAEDEEAIDSIIELGLIPGAKKIVKEENDDTLMAASSM